MKRRRGTDHSAHLHDAPAAVIKDEQFAQIFAAFGRPAILAMATALLVSTPLVATDSGSIVEGVGVSWHVLWLALAFVSLASSALLTQAGQRWHWADACVLGLVAWHFVSAYFCDGNQRHAWNAAWQWAAYGALAVVLRQQLLPGVETRALVAVMLALSLAVSLHAYYQYGYSQPKMRAEFDKDPETVLKQMGAEPDSPLQALAINRIKSVEPIGEFSLTNSLAGFLLPWFLMALAIAFWSVQRDGLVLAVAAGVGIGLALFGVLLLTKSRTAVLAAMGGCVLILLYCRRSGWKLDWRLPAGLAALGMVLGLVAVAAKGLDMEVLSESPKSVLYRIEYWRATAALIAEEPFLGVGPGNFRERYANHKLPEASETISDPHNFLLEIWSTAGTPALLALLALMGTTAWTVSKLKSVAPDEAPALVKTNLEAQPLALGAFAIAVGAVLGLILALILGFVADDLPATTQSDTLTASPNRSLGIPIIWLAAVPSYAFCYFLLRDWVAKGELPRAAVICALIALLVNLLAAGAALYAGVVNAAWLLWAIAMQEKLAPESQSTPTAIADMNRVRMMRWGAAMIALAGLVGCMYTEYWPITKSQMLIMEGASERNYAQASGLYDQAVAADPYSPEVKRRRAEFHYAVWQYRKQSTEYWALFERAMEAYEKSTPHHFVQHDQRGRWLLAAAHRVKNSDYLAEAAKAFEAAARCYPNSAYQHAQLAFVYHELGRTAEAKREADTAAKLNALCPHIEQKLENRKLYDPRWDPAARVIKSDQSPYAADFVNQLRGGSSSKLFDPTPKDDSAAKKQDMP